MDKYLVCEESRKAKRPILKSSDIVVIPLIGVEMAKLIDHEEDEALKAQYINMQDRVVKDPDNGIWYTYWDIALKKDEKQSVGCLYFDGPAELGSVTLTFKTDPRYTWDKRIAEALRLVTDWAMVQYGVYEIHTYISTTDDGYIRNAERADFVYREVDHGVEHYSKEKPLPSWMGLYMLIGIIIGFLMGCVFNSMPLGMAIALIVCLLFGGVMDQREAVTREQITGQKRQPRRIIAKKKRDALASALKAQKESDSDDENEAVEE